MKLLQATGRYYLAFSLLLFVLGGWIVMQFASIAFALDEQVAWWAHIGGAAAGAILVVVMRRPGVPLFDRGLG